MTILIALALVWVTLVILAAVQRWELRIYVRRQSRPQFRPTVITEQEVYTHWFEHDEEVTDEEED